MSVSLIAFPEHYVKLFTSAHPVALLLNLLLDTTEGLRLLGFVHVILLIIVLLRLIKLYYLGLVLYGGFIILMLVNLFTDGYGQIQSERLEGFALQLLAFTLLVYNIPEKQTKVKKE